MPWVAWLSTLLAFLGPAAFLAFGRRIRDVTRRGLGRRGGVLLCLRQFVLDSDKLLLQLSDSRRQFIAVLASVRRSGHRDQNLRQSAKCPYTNSQPVNGYGSGSRRTSLAMMFKLAQSAQKGWRKLNCREKIIPLLNGKKFVNGVQQDAA